MKWYMQYDSSSSLTEQEKLFLSEFTDGEFNYMCINCQWIIDKAYGNVKVSLKDAVGYFMNGARV